MGRSSRSGCTDLCRNDIGFIMDEFGLQPLEEERVRGIFKVRTDKGAFALKASRLCEDELCFVYRANNYLASRGSGVIFPHMLATVSGRPFLEYLGRLFTVSKWVDGREIDYLNLSDSSLAAAALAKLHQSSVGFRCCDVPSSRMLLGRWPLIFRKRLGQMLAFREMLRERDDLSAFERYYNENLPYYLREGMAALQLLENSSYYRKVAASREKGCLVHNDLAYHNILLTASGRVCFIDMDYALVDIDVRDVADMVLRNMYLSRWDWKRFELIIDSYESAASKRIDYDILLPFLRWPEAFWQIGLQYFVEHRSWSEETYLERIRRKTGIRAERVEVLNRLMQRQR